MSKLVASLLLLAASWYVSAATLSEQVAAMPPGTWARITAANTANDVDPARAGLTVGGGSGYRSIWEAWNSGALAPSYGTCGGILYFGGGHNDYYGNEVIALDLCGDNGVPKWRRLSDPYTGPITWPLANGAFPNGTPSPSHNYGAMEYDPNVNALWVPVSQTNAVTADVSKAGWLFSLDTKTWSGPYLHRGAMEGVTAYDTKRKVQWFQPKQGMAGELTSFDAATKAFTYYGWPYAYDVGLLDSIMGYDPDADLLVMTNFRTTTPSITEKNLANPAASWVRATMTGQPTDLRGQHAMAWSPTRHAFIVWIDALNSPNVYEVKRTGAAAYTWTKLTAAANTLAPVAVAHNGSYKKFQLVTVDGVEVLIGQLRVADGIMAFRLPAATGVEPPPPPPPPPGPTCMPREYQGLPVCPVSEAAKAVPPVEVVYAPTSLCKTKGILVCDRFSKAGKGVIAAGDSTPRRTKGTMMFTIPSGSGANAGGEYRVTFPPVGEGGFLAFSYRIKADAAALAQENRKEFILWRGSSSCTDLQLVQEIYYSRHLPMPYSNCGALHLKRELAGGDFLLQFPDYYCTYHGVKADKVDNCLTVRADEWNTYYVELQIGTYGKPDSRVTMWHKGESGEWKRYIDRDDFVFLGDGGFHQFMLTVYMTGKARTAHPEGHVWYDDLIMATKPFRLSVS